MTDAQASLDSARDKKMPYGVHLSATDVQRKAHLEQAVALLAQVEDAPDAQRAQAALDRA